MIADCIQEVFIDLWTNRSKRTHILNIKAYLLQSLKYKALQSRPKANKIIQMSNQVNVASEATVFTSDFDNQVQIQQAISQLTPRQSEVIHLKFYQNLTHEEIAQILSINTQSVSNIVYRALEKVRKIMKKNINKVSM